MAELPLSKFAPFTKEECHFQPEVSNKLDEIGVKCSNCIYVGEPIKVSEDDYFSFSLPDRQKHKCNIQSDRRGDNIVAENSMCRFFTDKEEIEDTTDDERMPSDFGPADTSEELSTQMQKLDFTNSDISNSINQLREKLINE